MTEKLLENIETGNVPEKKSGIEYQFSAEISSGDEKGIVHCYTVDGVKQYKVIAKDGNFDGVDQEKAWEKKFQRDKELKEKEGIEREL